MRFRLFFLLAAFGLIVGGVLESAFLRGPVLRAQFGEGLVTALASPDGKLIAATGRAQDGSWFCALYDLDGAAIGQAVPLRSPPGRGPALAWRSDSAQVAVANGPEVLVLSTNAEPPRRLRAAPTVRALTYGGPFLLARADGVALLWETQRYTQAWQLAQPYLLHASLNSDGSSLALASFEDGVRLYDPQKKRVGPHFEAGFTAAGLQFAEGSDRLIVGWRQGQRRNRDRMSSYHRQTGKPDGPTLATPQLRGFCASLDGRAVSVRTEYDVAVWNLDTGVKGASSDSESHLIDQLDARGERVLTALFPKDRPHAAELWSAKDGRTLAHFEHEWPISDIGITASGQLVIIGDRAAVWEYR